MPTTTHTRILAVQAPEMSEAIIVEASPVRSKQGIIAQVQMLVLQQHDVWLDGMVAVELDEMPGDGFSLEFQ